MKRKVGFAVAGVLAAFGALLVFLYLRDNRVQSAAPSPAPAQVSDQIPVEIDEELDGLVSGVEETDLSVLPADLAFELPTNGALTAFDAVGNIVELGEPIDVPPDYLTVVFGVSSERALGGRVRPGDTVAVIVSFADDVISSELDPSVADTAEEKAGRTTDVLLHKALVTDVQVEDIVGAVRTTDGLTVGVPEGSVSGTNSQVYYVTLALPSTQIERLIYALEYGQIWLANQPSTAGDATNGIVTQENIHEEVSIFIDRDDLLVGGPEDPADAEGVVGDTAVDVTTDGEGS